MRKLVLSLAVLSLVAVTLGGAPADAQATRTWVSGVGDDANPCSRTAPCKTFAGAISKTATAGEINVLDPGGFGGVTITKSITISSEGFEAGVLVSGTNAIIINAPANAHITLRGLDIEGLGTGLNGIRFLAGGTLHVKKCRIHNFVNVSNGFGISFTPSGASELHVVDTILAQNGTAGVQIRPTGTGSATFSLDRVTMVDNALGFRADGAGGTGAIRGTIRNSLVSGSSFAGITATTGATAVEFMLDNVVASNNAGSGVLATGAGAIIRMISTSVTGNSTGLNPQSSGQIVSHGGNAVFGNIGNNNGAPTSTVPAI